MPPVFQGFPSTPTEYQIPSDQCTQVRWILQSRAQPEQKENLICNEVESHIEFPALISDPFEVKGYRSLNPTMYPFTLTAALYESWEFRVEKILVSQMHPDLFNSSMLVEESQLLSQGSMNISPCSPEFVDPMSDACFVPSS